MRKKLTQGNIHFLNELMESYSALMLHELDDARKESIFHETRQFNSARTSFTGLQKLGQILETPGLIKLENDETNYVSVEGGWQRLALEEFAMNFGRYGVDAISGLSELLLYTNALSKAFGTGSLFYRGEHHYGYPLCSRAERNMEKGEGDTAGITERELTELRRFQSQFRSNLPYDFSPEDTLPDDDDPLWLPIMQHYDEEFGTRLLDITSSPFTGLYFACVAWDGTIDDTKDGLVYAFLPEGNMPIRGRYYDHMPNHFDEEMDELPVKRVEDCFKDWRHPEVLRLYQSSFSSPREMAQDGHFLVKGALTDQYGFGQGFKFRIPAQAKLAIVRELWLAGYTPKRMVRGELGLVAHQNLKNILKLKSL